jgi:hypothetical protein
MEPKGMKAVSLELNLRTPRRANWSLRGWRADLARVCQVLSAARH